MDILRIATAGSVDDGKSTLIGRLLYDTRSITTDKMEAIESASKRKGLDFTDLSLLTDGLIAEREQGITIDVAHIYFSTPTRKYIIADSPGHVEYTRNMITGASNAEASFILVDARKGVVEQTRRHFYISSLLRIRHVVFCINKMDLVDYRQDVYEKICADAREMVTLAGFEGQDIRFIPLAAKYGDNIVKESTSMKWYTGDTLLSYLEKISPAVLKQGLPTRFPIQYVVRPHQEAFHDFRGYAGKLASGKLSKGDDVTVLPTLQSTKIKSIHSFTEEKESAHADESVVITLEDNVDISRGNMLVKACDSLPQHQQLKATLCWMSESGLTAGKTLLLQQGVNRVKSRISAIHSVMNIQTMETDPDKKSFQLNDIGEVEIKLAKPVFADLYAENPANGSFILIDEFTHHTVGVGFVR